MIRIFSGIPAFREIEQAVPEHSAIDGVEYNAIINDPRRKYCHIATSSFLKWHPGMAIDDLKKMLRPEAKLVLCVKREEEGKDTSRKISHGLTICGYTHSSLSARHIAADQSCQRNPAGQGSEFVQGLAGNAHGSLCRT